MFVLILFILLLRESYARNSSEVLYDPNFTRKCLDDPTYPCPLDPCPPDPPPKECLISKIRAWFIPYKRVECCFRCCMVHYISKYKLMKNYRYWRKVVAGCSYSSDYGSPTSLVYGYNNAMMFSDIGAWWKKSCSGYKIAATEGPNSGYIATMHDKWDTLLGCVVPKMAPNNVTVVIGHFPFPVVRRHHKWIIQSNVNFMQMEPRPDFTKYDLKYPGKMKAMPLGVLHPSKWPKLLNGREANITGRPHLLYCPQKMAKQNRAYRKIKVAHMVKNGLTCDFPQTNEGMIDKLLESAFVASPAGTGPSNFRDWEALTAGAIPLVDDYPPLYELFDGMPVVKVKDWSKVTPEFLRNELKRLLKLHSEGRLYVHKVYSPYWIYQLTRSIDTWTETISYQKSWLTCRPTSGRKCDVGVQPCNTI
eukprot:NODE_3089_length_1427_cov_37.541411_g2684_i0.p1 GENE.NODE_3089_length_1427_cov_37.541411_g2684_i0~~NODE_3089_length_1427_cov_37.541411_g2684_i0.p1  ORF type:complete len:439 (-),score=59.43 NODE_3089_length_1427_cov_37.541411_g2684_i0:111-1367(-)